MTAHIFDRLAHGDRGLAWVGIGFGLLAFWMALPPLKVREPVLPVMIGLLASVLGVWGPGLGEETRLGGVVIGVLGIAFGCLATRSSVTHLDQIVVWSALTAAMLRYAAPLAFAAMGGIGRGSAGWLTNC